MRALLISPGPQFSVADVFAGLAKGLRQNGVTVASFDLASRLNFYAQAHIKLPDDTYRKAFNDDGAVRLATKGVAAACYEFWPDVVVIVSGFYVPPEVYAAIRRRRQTVVLVHTEEPYETAVQLQRAAGADLNLINDPLNIEQFREVAPTEYLPHAFDPDVHHPGPASPDLVSDFAFCGTGYQGRIDFFESVDWTGIDVALAGNWQATDEDSALRKHLAHDIAECFDNTDTADLLRSAKVTANLYREPRGWAMGPREVEAAAIGCFMLRESRGEGDEVLPMLPRFSNVAEFGDLLRWWLAHDVERQAVADKAREAIAGRTFAANAAQLLRLLAKR